ncbi:MAG: hypothetical protein ISR69_12675 [Gammaproteobacteria bacterium]|nr:hypothetical protein [Gammaproteobacteria bacterium]
MKLVQKKLFKVHQEFEIIDDYVNVFIKVPFQEEERLKVMLTVLNPEPVIRNSCLEFNSRVNGEALISLLLEKPNTQDFNDFVSILKSRALDEYNLFAGLKSANHTLTQAGNVTEEPPEFEDEETLDLKAIKANSDHQKIAFSITMLEQSLNNDDIKEFLTALKKLESEPKNESYLRDVINAFNSAGPKQGAILTYAPYISILLTDENLLSRK